MAACTLRKTPALATSNPEPSRRLFATLSQLTATGMVRRAEEVIRPRENDVVVPSTPYNMVTDVIHHDPPDIRVVIGHSIDPRESVIILPVVLVQIPVQGLPGGRVEHRHHDRRDQLRRQVESQRKYSVKHGEPERADGDGG